MRFSEFVSEYREPREYGKAHRDGIDLEAWKDGLEFQIDATAHGRELGRVLFDVQYQGDQPVLVAKDLMILPEYRGQGIAAIMYDYAKELGYVVERSREQTDAGKHFWDKNRGKEGQVWETYPGGPAPMRKTTRLCELSDEELDEVINHPSIKTKTQDTSGLVNKGEPVPPGKEQKLLGNLVGRLGQYEVYKWDKGTDSAYSVFDPKTRISQMTISGHNKPNRFEIFGIYGGPQSPVRAADLYAWLVKNQGLTLVSDKYQSPGGQRVWQELEQRYGRSVNVYAYNMRTNEPINTGADDPESTHGTRGDIAQNVRLVASPK